MSSIIQGQKLQTPVPVLPESRVQRTLYTVGTKMFSLPDRTTHYLDAKIAKGSPSGISTRFKKMMRYFLPNILFAQEYHTLTPITLGKRISFSLPRPSAGALFLMLWCATFPAREFQAAKRAHRNNNDYRECGDVARRDVTSIALILYALEPAILYLNKLKHRFDGLEIVDRGKNQVLTYKQFENYRLVNSQVLIRMLEENNGPGLIKASREILHERGLHDAVGTTELNDRVIALKQLIPELVAAHDKGEVNYRNRLADEIIQIVQDSDAMTDKAYEAARKGGSPEAVKTLEKLQGSFSNFVTQYAKTRRLPVDMAGFALVTGMMGFLPVWFNAMWNKHRFEQHGGTSTAQDSAPLYPSGSGPAGNPFSSLPGL